MEEPKISQSEFRKMLEQAEDKFGIFADKGTLAKCEFKISQLIKLITEFLSDEQKAKLFTLEHFKKLDSHIEMQIIESISDEKIRREIIEDSEYVSGIEICDILEIAKSLDEDNKIKLLSNPEFVQRLGNKSSVVEIAKTLAEATKTKMLFNKEFNKLGVEDWDVLYIITSLQDERTKTELIEIYQFNKEDTLTILTTFSDESKIESLLKNEYGLDKSKLVRLVATLSVNRLVEFFKENKEFFDKNEIKPYDITRKLTKEGQLEFIPHIDDMGLSIEVIRKILVSLKDDTKESIDMASFPEEYATAIKIEFFGGKILLDLNEDLEIYRGLDSMIEVNAMKVTDEERRKLPELFEICPQVNIRDDLYCGVATIEEYKEAETWIETVLQGIDPTWSDIQKIAFIDNAVGKKISYSPDFDTEIFDEDNSRIVWRIICTGYGVCNGIAQVEQYILKRIGIEAERVSGVMHAFLRLKNIEIPNADGSTSVGDTIIDPTWNLAAHRYGAFPENFCKSYEEIRKNDIDDDKNDRECHRNDVELRDVKLGLDEQSLREVFASIGIANKAGKFPITELINKSNIIADTNLPTEVALEKQLLLLVKYYPEFATCNNSTSKILKSICLKHDNFSDANKIVVNRVYERDDKSKRPVLYVYADIPSASKKFYIADKNTEAFLEMPQEQFEEKFECYDMDMEKNNGHRPWEEVEQEKETENLAQSSGNIVASLEGEEK